MKRNPLNIGRRAKLGVAAIVATSLMLAGCADPGISENPATPGEATGDPVTGGTMVVALSGDPTTMDIGFNSNALTLVSSTSVFEQLFAHNSEFIAQPMIAEGYEVSEDLKTYTITLREGVTFHNGETVDADDVVASLKRWGSVSGIGQQSYAGFTSLVATDASTVTITLDEPQYSLINDLAYNVQGAIVIPEEIASAYMDVPIPDEETIGTGPYMLDEYIHGEKITLNRFNDYSAREGEPRDGFSGTKHAYVDTVELRFVSDPNQQMNGLQTGQFNWAQNIGPDNFDVADANPVLNPIVTGSGLVASLLMNFNEEANTADPRVREALNMVINKTDMATAAFGPESLWTPQDGSIVLAENSAMHSTEGREVFESYDPEAAKALFEEAGITADNPIRIFTTQTYPKYYQMAVVIQAALESIGLKADVQVFDFPTMITKLTEDPTGWDIGMTAFSGTITSPAQVLFLTPSWPGEYVNPGVDEIKSTYNLATSAEEAQAQVDALQRLIWDDLPVITVAPNRSFITTAGLENPSDFGLGIYWDTWLSE